MDATNRFAHGANYTDATVADVYSQIAQDGNARTLLTTRGCGENGGDAMAVDVSGGEPPGLFEGLQQWPKY